MNPPKIDRNIYILALATGITWLGATAIIPFLSLIIRHEGGSFTILGIIIGSFYAGSIVASYPVGLLSDRVSRKAILLGSLFLYGIATAAFLLNLPPTWDIIWRIFQGVGATAIEVTALSSVALLSPPEIRGKAYSIVMAGLMIGIAIGPLVGGLYNFWGPDWVFLVAFFAVVVAMIIVLLYLHVPLPPKDTESSNDSSRTYHISSLFKQRFILGLIILSAGFGLIMGNYDTNWSLLMELRHSTDFEISLSWTLFALPYAFMTWPAGWLADHYDRRKICLLAGLCCAAFSALYPFVMTVPLLLVLAPFEAAGEAAMMPSFQSLLTSSVPASRLGQIQGSISTITNGVTIIAASGAGFLWHLWFPLPFVCTAALYFFLLAIVIILWHSLPDIPRSKVGNSRLGVNATLLSPDISQT